MSKVTAIDMDGTSSAYFAPATVMIAERTVHVSGQVGNTKDGTVPSDYVSQIHLALHNLRKVMTAAGASIRDISKLTLYVVDYDPAARKHTRHLIRFLAGHRPAVTLVPVSQLAARSWLFEIEATLSLPQRLPVSLPLQAVRESVDVVIIGAGLAGLTAAHGLLSRGYSCIVLEARDRVGGKTWSQELDGGKGIAEFGAAWINDTSQSRMYGLARKYGVELIEQNTKGDCVFQGFDGQCSPFPYGEIPKFDEPTRAHLVKIRDMVEADCQLVDAWMPKDTHLDSLTFEAYLESRGADKTAIATAAVWTRAMLGQEPSDISALFFLNYCKSGGGLLAMRSDRKGGGQHLRMRQGAQFIARNLAKDLPASVIRLSSQVQIVVQEKRQTAYVCAADSIISARKVITTVPGPALESIRFSPELPPAKTAWLDSLKYGYYCKALMEFRSPFWVEKGYCGLVQSFVGPASVVRDTSCPADGKYLLTCFMAGNFGQEWSSLPSGERERALLAQLQKLYDIDDLESLFITMHCYEWSKDEHAGWGCPSVALAPGVLDSFGGDALRSSWKDVHFAGTETAGEWKGYMEGAVRSGDRVALEVANELRSGVLAQL